MVSRIPLFSFLVAGVVVALAAAAPQTRIVNGDDAAEGQFPYQAQLYIAGTPTCGATVLSENYVLTLANCVCYHNTDVPWPPQVFSVRAGSTDLYTGGVQIVVEEIFVNKDYVELQNALAILKLTKSLVFSSTIQAISVAKENPPAGATVYISGFGRLKITDEYMYRTLQWYDDVMLDEAECVADIGAEDPTLMCLGHPRKFGICTGDFGSPAAYNGELVGAAAYILSEECGTADPDVYISIPYFREWILETIAA